MTPTLLRAIMACPVQDGYALGKDAGEGEFAVAFEANAGSQQARLEPGQVAYIATGDMQCSDCLLRTRADGLGIAVCAIEWSMLSCVCDSIFHCAGAPLPVGADRVVPIEQTEPHAAGSRPAVTIKQVRATVY